MSITVLLIPIDFFPLPFRQLEDWDSCRCWKALAEDEEVFVRFRFRELGEGSCSSTPWPGGAFRLRRDFEEVGVGAALDGDAGEAAIVEILPADETAWSEDCLVDERVTLRGGMNKCPSFVTFLSFSSQFCCNRERRYARDNDGKGKDECG